MASMIRTPVEDLFLREMSDDSDRLVCEQDECSGAIDEYLDQDPGLFDNTEDLIDYDEYEDDIFD